MGQKSKESAVVMSKGILPGSSEYFFSSRPYLSLRSHPAVLSFILTSTCGQATGRVQFFIRKNTATLPWLAPYGCIELSGSWSEGELQIALQSMVQMLRSQGLEGIRITLLPAGLDSCTPILKMVLNRLGFVTDYYDVSYHIPISESYDDRVRQDVPRRIAKCRKAGFTFERWEEPDTDFLFSFIMDSRIEKSYPLNLSKEDLSLLLSTFPEQYLVFIVKDGTQVIAVLVSVLVNDGLLYYFLPADHPDYRRYGPMKFLIAELVAYCQQRGIQTLDLGIATDRGEVNDGLTLFKKNVGGIASDKPTLSIRF